MLTQNQPTANFPRGGGEAVRDGAGGPSGVPMDGVARRAAARRETGLPVLASLPVAPLQEDRDETLRTK